MVGNLKNILATLGYGEEDISKLLPAGLNIEEMAKLELVRKVAGQEVAISQVRTDMVTPLFMIWGGDTISEGIKRAGGTPPTNFGSGHFLVTTRAVAGLLGPYPYKGKSGSELKEIWASPKTLDEVHSPLGLATPLSVKQGVGRCRSLTPSEYASLREEWKGLFSPSLAVVVKVKGLDRPTRRGGTVEVSNLVLKWGQLTEDGKESLATAIIRGLKVVLGVSGSRITLTLGGVGEVPSIPRKENVPAAN